MVMQCSSARSAFGFGECLDDSLPHVWVHPCPRSHLLYHRVVSLGVTGRQPSQMLTGLVTTVWGINAVGLDLGQCVHSSSDLVPIMCQFRL